MEDIYRLKKSFIKHFESTLISTGKDLTKEFENKYRIDEQIFLDYALNLCNKLVKMEGVSSEDEKKCKEFIKSFYYLDEIKSMN